MKVKRSIAKRFKVVGQKRVKRYRSGMSHLLAKKSKRRKKALRKVKGIPAGYERAVKKALGLM